MVAAWLLAQAAAAGVAPAPTLQAQFERATAALTSQIWDEALKDFQVIEARPGLTARSRGIVALREGQAMYHLGRPEAAETLHQGLALIPNNDVNLADDRIDALLVLGGISEAISILSLPGESSRQLGHCRMTRRCNSPASFRWPTLRCSTTGMRRWAMSMRR